MTSGTVRASGVAVVTFGPPVGVRGWGGKGGKGGKASELGLYGVESGMEWGWKGFGIPCGQAREGLSTPFPPPLAPGVFAGGRAFHPFHPFHPRRQVVGGA